MGSRTLFLIDGHAFCYRAFHAVRNLATSDGRPTNAVYGFAVMLRALREKERPDYLAVAFDVGKPTFRHRQFEAYKVQRKPMPDPLIAQLPVIKSLLAAYRIPMFELEGYEGEDVLATIARRVQAPDLEVFLVTGDKDALQLVNSHLKVYNPHHEGALLDAGAVLARYGVGPEQMVDLMALMGDEVDNIPGVPGIGEKTASKLLQRFGTLEELYRRLDEVESTAQRQRLVVAREQVLLSRDLARIHTDVPLTVRLEDLAVRDPDWKTLRALFRDLEFKRLLATVEQTGPAATGDVVTLHHVTQEVHVEELLAAVAVCKTSVALVCDAGSTDGVPPLLAIAPSAKEAWVATLEASFLQGAAGKRLSRWLADPAAQKVGHDVKAVLRRLGTLDVKCQGLAGDTLLAAYLLNPSRTDQRLGDLTEEYLDERLVSPGPVKDLTGPAAFEALGQQACAIGRLHEQLVPRLQEHALEALYRQVELPLASVLAQMEQTGVAVDLSYLQHLHTSMDAQLTRLTEEVFRLAGMTFNVNSPKQLAHVLFERLGLPVVKRTKTGPSTDADVLQHLAQKHPLPSRLMEYRALSKLVSTYIEALPKLVDPSTGRLHTSFNQTATATGRLSSSEPNLQNIPVKTELGRQIRRAFMPGGPYEILVALDYSQIELRILAHLSQDTTLVDAFQQDRDIHRFTASLIYGVPEDEVQPEQRNAMKAINYGIVYGMSAHGLAKELGRPYEEAQAFIDAYFQRYPKVRAYLDEQIARATDTGFVQTLLGRRRYIPELRSADPMVRQFGERMAVNAPIQGSAADLIKRAMLEVSTALRARGLESRMILQVHDELLFESSRQERNTLVEVVRPLMEGVIPLAVPLTVTVKAGPNWLDLRKIE